MYFLYLAYGSNLYLNMMFSRCKDAKIIKQTYLDGFRLAFKGVSDYKAYLTPEVCKNSNIPVVLYDISSDDLVKLDLYESFPRLYHKELFKFDNRVVMMYVMNEEYDYHIPTDEYVNICKLGYMNHGFDPDILDDAYKYTEDNIKRLKLKG